MTDVLDLVSGEIDTFTDPANFITLASGEIVRIADTPAEQTGWEINAGERVPITIPASASVDCATQDVTPVGETAGGCNTAGGCASPGEKHRIHWDHTGCVDASLHIALRQSRNGGTFEEVVDDVSCDAANPDAGCGSDPGCTPDGQAIITEAFHNDISQTTDYTYEIRIETDGGDIPVDTLQTSGCTDCGGDDDCLEL